ncbi:cation:proton antiporter [Wenzhouxiangella sp. XN24]|uniref:cation:proton antiporter n=1 Tax=Wenzhouxiangella sp. XN24 TaxID=2713569 RepID=UPI0013ED995C|nr:cation:proton antiporter [Wenzhouxiangella sp. XN24]NGX17201.1 sodium:proton exchanger [Wenzhouxiangella sp. XN24]
MNDQSRVFLLQQYEVGLLLVGAIILAAAILPRLLSRQRRITAPLLYMAAGAVVFLLPGTPELPNLVDNAWWPMRLTELGVIVALTSAGLKLNRPFAWETWRISWRLLAVTMPLTIAATAALGWWAAGLLPASALLLGAVIAPTDPVLASDVQTTPPGEPDDSQARLALTTEAGLNDGLAFPFTNLAIAVALAGLAPAGWLADWLLVDVAYKVVAGTLVGLGAGYLLAKIIIGTPATRKMARTMTGVPSLSLTLIPYGAAELVSSYGFIAVFVAACTFRQYEADHDFQVKLHNFSEEIERVFVAVLMFLIGAYAVSGGLALLTPAMWLVVLATLFVVRPAAGLVGLAGTRLPWEKRWAIAFLGIRGIGSIYYLAYAVFHADFPDAGTVWALMLATVVISVVIHGLAARPAIEKVTPSVD